MRSQTDIYQDVASLAISAISDTWVEIVIKYWVEEYQSLERNTYLKQNDGIFIEEGIPYLGPLDDLLRELREHLAQGGKERFSGCVIQIKQSGAFETDFSYGPVDWTSHYDGAWHFDTDKMNAQAREKKPWWRFW